MDVWTEKYRPKRLKDIVGQDEIVERLEAFVRTQSLPHLLFAGPAGTGKTTASLCIARELYGDGYKQNILELNASDERGIDVVRHKVKDFARTMSLGDIPYKLIYLDESDALTREAQQALRRTMENYSSTCRFILSCNYSSKIIEPIQSRCSVFRFKPIGAKELAKRIEHVAKDEKIHITKEAVDTIVLLSEGDVRNAINMLQSAASTGKNITEETIYEVTSRAKPKEVKELLELALANNFPEARKKLEDLLIKQGLAALDVIREVHSAVFALDLPDADKIALVDKVGEYEFRLVEGADERIQLDALLAQFTLYAKKK